MFRDFLEGSPPSNSEDTSLFILEYLSRESFWNFIPTHSVCLSQRPGHAPPSQVAVGELSLCRTKTGECPAFVRRTHTRTKDERLRAVRVRSVPFRFRQGAPSFRRLRDGAHTGTPVCQVFIANPLRRVAFRAPAPMVKRSPAGVQLVAVVPRYDQRPGLKQASRMG